MRNGLKMTSHREVILKELCKDTVTDDDGDSDDIIKSVTVSESLSCNNCLGDCISGGGEPECGTRDAIEQRKFLRQFLKGCNERLAHCFFLEEHKAKGALACLIINSPDTNLLARDCL